MVNIIVAVGNYIVNKGFPMGKNGSMPWNNKADLKWFKDITTGHPVIMGRKTFDAIGHPLKNRTNIVVTSRDEYQARYGNQLKVVSDVEEAIAFAKTIDEEIFIIGGASIYDYALSNDLVDRIYIDMLSEDAKDADTFFPRDIVTDNCWEEIGRPVEIESKKAYAMQFVKMRGRNNNVDSQYLDLVNKIIKEGVEKDTRAGKTRSIFGVQMRFNLKEGLPMLTTKKMFAKGVIHELLWFLKGDTNIKYLVDNGVHIWDDDAYRYYLEHHKLYGSGESLSKEEYIEKIKNGDTIVFEFTCGGGETQNFEFKCGDLGPVYGAQWRSWGSWYGGKGFDQVKEVIEKLRNNPDDRRIMISAWNVGEINLMALPPCHYCCQFYTKKMTIKERTKWAIDNEVKFERYDCYLNPSDEELTEMFDKAGVPKRKLSCMWNQRSVDCGLGLGFNILSYSILTHMVAQCCNMDVDELIFSGGDVHVYENHIEPLKEQLTRNPHMYALPTLKLNSAITEIDDFTYEDIKIEGYKSYPTIKMPLSVGL